MLPDGCRLPVAVEHSRSTMKRINPTALAVLAVLITGCASVSSTTIFYTPTSNVVYPPKPKGWVVPVMAKPPGRPYAEIGRFAFQSDLGYPFMMKALEYNARMAGADAVILSSSKSWSLPSGYNVPTTVGWLPAWSGCGGWYGGAVPVVYPGYSGVTYNTFTGIEARMIVYRP